MIKFTGTGKGDQKVLFVGITDANVAMLLTGKPIKLIGSEVGCSHDIYIFHGRTEQAMIDELRRSGVQLPTGDNAHTHHDDDRQEGGGSKH